MPDPQAATDYVTRTAPPRGRIAVVLALVALAVVTAARAVAFLVYVTIQIRTPAEAFYLEAHMVHLAWRVQQGITLYPPWRDGPYVTNVFGPVYFLVVGGIGRALGVDLDHLFFVGRGVTVAAVVATTVLLGLFAGRRYGTWAGAVAALVSLGCGPLFGFGVMARADALADFLGLAGFLLAIGRFRGATVAGAAVLVVAVFTKQPNVVYVLAAVLALLATGRTREAIGLAVGVGTAVAAIVVAVTLTLEPGFASGLTDASLSPWDVAALHEQFSVLTDESPDLLILAAIGCVLWLRTPTRDIPLLILAVTLTTFCFLFAAKVGSDLNYFLPLRNIGALSAAALVRVVIDAQGGAWRRWVLVTVCVTVGFVPSVLRMRSYASRVASQQAYYRSTEGQRLRREHEEIVRLLRDPRRNLLTDSGFLDIQQGARTNFGDPWVFRLFSHRGHLNLERMKGKLAGGFYECILTTSPLERDDYRTYDFGLPMPLVEVARRHYVLSGRKAGMFVYLPRPKVSR